MSLGVAGFCVLVALEASGAARGRGPSHTGTHPPPARSVNPAQSRTSETGRSLSGKDPGPRACVRAWRSAGDCRAARALPSSGRTRENAGTLSGRCHARRKTSNAGSVTFSRGAGRPSPCFYFSLEDGAHPHPEASGRNSRDETTLHCRTGCGSMNTEHSPSAKTDKM